MFEINSEFYIAGRAIGIKHPAYFIADIAANHDGDIERAKNLIYQAAEAGANAAKFQHFKAETIVSDLGFKTLGSQQAHQSKWKKSVVEVYKDASVDLDWTATLYETCKQAGIAFFTSPYAFDLVDHVDPYVPAYKIGSGEITWLEMIEYIASKGKPFILASGASSMDDVHRAVTAAVRINPDFALMQCNTNYTGSLENFRFIQLNVLRSFHAMYPDMVLGLSDHTPGHATVLGAVALGARIIEKHFTDNVERTGPDHAFSMDPKSWRDMVDRTRELENALGCGVKQVEENEQQTVVVQRRALRSARDLPEGHILQREDISVLRPCPVDAIMPFSVSEIVGRQLRKSKTKEDHFKNSDFL